MSCNVPIYNACIVNCMNYLLALGISITNLSAVRSERERERERGGGGNN